VLPSTSILIRVRSTYSPIRPSQFQTLLARVLNRRKIPAKSFAVIVPQNLLPSPSVQPVEHCICFLPKPVATFQVSLMGYKAVGAEALHKQSNLSFVSEEDQSHNKPQPGKYTICPWAITGPQTKKCCVISLAAVCGSDLVFPKFSFTSTCLQFYLSSCTNLRDDVYIVTWYGCGSVTDKTTRVWIGYRIYSLWRLELLHRLQLQ
jgi:hypothetical protein